MADNVLEKAADIVSAFVSKNSVPLAGLPNLIASVHAALTELATGSTPANVASQKEPAVSINKSITSEYLICLEDGKKFKSLKRHLRTSYNLTPEQSREKWGLPDFYPMVAPSYAISRSALAKSIGLGQMAQGRAKGKK